MSRRNEPISCNKRLFLLLVTLARFLSPAAAASQQRALSPQALNCLATQAVCASNNIPIFGIHGIKIGDTTTAIGGYRLQEHDPDMDSHSDESHEEIKQRALCRGMLTQGIMAAKTSAPNTATLAVEISPEDNRDSTSYA